VPDTLNAILEYPEGFTVNLSSSFNNELNADAAFQVLGTEGSITIGADGLAVYPENAVEDNRWIVDAWAQPLEDAYYKDPKVIAAEIEPAKRPPESARAFQGRRPRTNRRALWPFLRFHPFARAQLGECHRRPPRAAART
jgi:predicted dehydrogenase